MIDVLLCVDLTDKMQYSKSNKFYHGVSLFYRHDHVLVLKVLNYRILSPSNDDNRSVAWAQDCVDTCNWSLLIQNDQSAKERLNRNVLENFLYAPFTLSLLSTSTRNISVRSCSKTWHL